jgi:hypothetical protein
MSTTAEYISAVRAATADTPYIVKETPKGFDLTIDVADARWLTLLKAHGLKKVFTHEVTLDEAKQQLTIVDVSNSLRWGAGGSSPRLQAEKIGKVVDYSFDAGEGRGYIRDVAKAQGWSEKMGGEQKGAMIFAGVVLVLMVIGFGGWGIVSLLN